MSFVKLYVHYEEGDLTTIVQAEKTGTFDEVILTVVNLIKKKHNISLDPKTLVLANSRHAVLKGEVQKKVKGGEDLYLWTQVGLERAKSGKTVEAQQKSPTLPTPNSPSTIIMGSGPPPLEPIDPNEQPSMPMPTTPMNSTDIPIVTTPSSKRTENKQRVVEYGGIVEPVLPQEVESPCPVCNEFIVHPREAKQVFCSACRTTCLLVTIADTQATCSSCSRTVHRFRGQKTMSCKSCGFKTAMIVCDGCRTAFAFPVGLNFMPCVGCKKQLFPSQVTAHPLPQFGILVNKDVNVLPPFDLEIASKKPRNCVINLVVQYYKDTSPQRQKEIDDALDLNIRCTAIDLIHLLLEHESDLPEKYRNQPKLKVSLLGSRWLFSDAFKYCNQNLKGQVCIVANSDIFFDHTLFYLHRTPLRGKLFALTRTDVLADGSLLFNEWTAPICQDTWIFQSPVSESIVSKTNFCFGLPGCDNHVAWLFREEHYHIVNPCLKIITRHLHSSEKRNPNLQKVQGEYMQVPPNGDI
eukprot:TRINITY_DN12544_c0_g1_i3.p1 TRINITY_DN12544_c0_g1~~TRINITY_DN12544_c0_g1_i3.p1  ORF type:complete len:522 (-),score=91.66 TRINITY_DN12544_c0_g1_i3:68-1633(-)